MQENIYVTKATGEREAFNEDKVIRSLRQAQVPPEHESRILNAIRKDLYQNIPTREIYRHVQDYLSQSYPRGRVRYQLKKAIMGLGPTGYPFEVYVSEILKKYGYTTQVGQSINGSCVTHEVDVLAQKTNQVYFVECKFHNQPGMRCDIKVALYVQARGEDLAEKSKAKDNSLDYYPWIFTNTKFSSDAISYAECKKLRLTGWDYPLGNSLQIMIEKKGLYPLTILNCINDRQKQRLMENNIVLARSLLDTPNLASLLDLSRNNLDALKKECELLNGD